ncbi:MAG: T9SS type A sorting domain-containing protein [Actinobacteria bacterium]|nr:T9SS type A sorting domain-containing protein [Actinomycetota bacterium]
MRLSIFLLIFLLIPAVAMSTTFTISDISWSDIVDHDGDEFSATRTLNFSIAVSDGSRSVRVRIFYTQMNGDVWLDGPQTDAFNVSSAASVGKSVAVPPLMEYGVGIYKFRLELVDSANPQEVLATLEPEDAEALYYQFFESVSYDDIFQGKPFIVVNTDDSGPGSLRQAITLAQTLSPDNARILFNLAKTDANHDARRETWSVNLDNPLPLISNMGSLSIDGFSQPYENDHGMGYPIVIDGRNTESGSGLDVSSSRFLNIRGIQVLNFKEAAVSISTVNSGIIYNCILGTDSRTVPEARSQYGLFLHNVLQFDVGASGIWIGNSIVGNVDFGVLVSFSSNISILTNNFGTPAFLTDFLNPATISVGIQAQNNSHDIKIIRNRFMDSGETAVQFISCGQSAISYNQINTDSTWTRQSGFFRNGVYLTAKSDSNLIQGNSIGYCEGTAILVDGQSVDNRLTQNGISRNGAGIVLRNGGNNDMPTADLDRIEDDTLYGLAGPGFHVEIFGDEGDQARVYLGSTTVDDGMNFSFNLANLLTFPNVTATVTDGNGNTGYISAPLSWQPDAGLATLVTNTSDSGPGSLRDALEAAAKSEGPDSIRFNIPFSDPGYDAGSGTWTISPASMMVISTKGLVMDGASQAGFIGSDANPFGPEIVIDGHLSPDGAGLYFISCRSIVVQDLVITNFAENLDFIDSDIITVAECYLGTDALGQTAGETSGLGVFASDCRDILIGSETKSRANLISGNENRGILFNSCSTSRIENNRIGVDRTGQKPLHNDFESILVQSGSDSISITGNQVAGKIFGIRLIDASHTQIQNNTINTDSTFLKDLGDGAGILLQEQSNDNLIAENQISFCQRAVVIADTSLRNTLSRNRITANGQAIILVEGGNNLLPAPVLTAATRDGTTGTAGANQTIQVFADSTNQGEIFLGETATDASGAFHLEFDHTPERPNVTAIATDADGNSSTFSWPMLVTGVDDLQSISTPNKFSVSEGYPNPFNPQTTIQIALPKDGQVTAAIYDLLGRRVRLLFDKQHQAGIFALRWNGKNDAGAQVSSGVYLLQCRTQDENQIRKLTLIR